MNTDEVRVVVVDDLADSAEALAAVLQSNGYRVWTVTDGERALAAIEARRPHCVLFDVLMPGMNGAELVRRLRERYGDEIVLIAVTGVADTDEDVADAFIVADHYLRKPVDVAALERLLPPLDRY